MNSRTYRNFDVTADGRGITTVTLDMPGRPINVLGAEVLEELDQIVHDLEQSEQIKLVVFQSGKESGFLAGADVREIAHIGSARQAMQSIEMGQTLFQRIEWLPMPTVAVIHGPCLGGGLELALACKYRVARDDRSTKIGLPEIKLGLIPAWGGTQRLPRIAGLSNALPMILTGKHLTASDAMRIGLVDQAVAPDRWQVGLAAIIDRVLAGEMLPASGRRPWWQQAIEATYLGRAVIFRSAERQIASKQKLYPALAAALRAVRLGYESGVAGFLCERNDFVDLLATPTCRHLIGLFFARQRAQSLGTWCRPPAGATAHRMPIRTVGVIGAGAMGAGIGQLAAIRGYNVVIKEIDDRAAADGWRRIEKMIHEVASRKGWSPSERDRVRGRISIGCDDQSLAACDLIIEAVVEREEVKNQVFRRLDNIAQRSAILASNTSSLSVTRMAAVTARPAQVAGLHFFNPVHRMELVEVVRAAETDDATLARLVAFVKALGKIPIVTADSPGFLVNRVLFPYLGEAVLMVGEGHDVVEMDKQVRRFGMPMGPLELLDQVGLDVALHVANSLHHVLPGTRSVIDRLSTLVDRGHLGRKSKLGFYHYRKGKRRNPARLPLTDRGVTPTDLGNEFLEDGMTPIARRLIYPMLAEAVRCHQQQIVAEPWAIDLAMVLGTGFAPHRGGPLHVIDAIGPRQVMGNLRRLRSQLGDRFAPPPELIEMSDLGETFFAGGDKREQEYASS